MRSAERIFLCGVMILSLIACARPVSARTHPATAPDTTPGRTFCLVGQSWPGFNPDWAEAGRITGDGQTFCALVDPTAGCDCPLGFEISTLDMIMTVAEDMPVPFTVTVSMGLKRAVPAAGDVGTWKPGSTICETPVLDFHHYVPKEYVGFGIALDCWCADMGYPYFIFFTIHSSMQPPGGLYTTGTGPPAPGRFWTRVDGQWVDMAVSGMLTRGDLVTSGFARCCELPIPAAESSWGGVKAIYR